MYQMVSDKMTFNHTTFMESIEEAVDPALSPLPPANLAVKEDDFQYGTQKSKLSGQIKPVVETNDPYTTQLAGLDEFAHDFVPHGETMR